MGVKYAVNIKNENFIFKPNFGLVATYDIISDHIKMDVNVIDGGNYQIIGDPLHKFGIKTNLGITIANNDLNISLEYDGGFKKDFQNHGGILKIKYVF